MFASSLYFLRCLGQFLNGGPNKRSILSTREDRCTRGLFRGLCEGLPGGIFSGHGEVGGIFLG